MFVTAAVTDNTFQYDSAFLSWWSTSYPSFGNNPAQTSAPPPVTVGSGWSIEAPGPYGSPRFPWVLAPPSRSTAPIRQSSSIRLKTS